MTERPRRDDEPDTDLDPDDVISTVCPSPPELIPVDDEHQDDEPGE